MPHQDWEHRLHDRLGSARKDEAFQQCGSRVADKLGVHLRVKEDEITQFRRGEIARDWQNPPADTERKPTWQVQKVTLAMLEAAGVD